MDPSAFRIRLDTVAPGLLNRGVFVMPKDSARNGSFTRSQLSFLNRSVNRAPELIQQVFRHLRRREEEVVRLHSAIGVIPVARPVELIRPGPDRHVDRRPARHSLFRVKGVRHQVHRFNRLGRRNIRDDVWQPRITHRRAVQSRIVVRIRKRRSRSCPAISAGYPRRSAAPPAAKSPAMTCRNSGTFVPDSPKTAGSSPALW